MPTRPNTRWTLLLMAAVAVAAAACSGASGAVSSSPGAGPERGPAVIVIGASLSLTGPLGPTGRALESGYQREIAAVDAQGGVDIGGAGPGGVRAKLRLVALNNAGDPGTAAAQASELVQRDHAVALLGSAAPEIVLPVAVTAEQLRVPFLTSELPVEAFASGDKTGWTYAWDLFYDERQQATDAARALAAAGGGDKNVALFTDSEPDSVVERPLYEAAFAAVGLRVVGDYTFPVAATNFAPFIAQARAAGAQLVAGQLTPADGAALLRQVSSAGFRPRAAFVAGTAAAGYQPPSLGRLAPDTLAGGPQDAPATAGYAVAEVLTDALAAARSVAPAAVTAAIGRTRAQTPAGLITFSPATHTATVGYRVTG